MENKYQIVIFDEECVASQYGVQTYIDQLVDVLISHNNVAIFHIYLLSSCKELELIRNKKISTIRIPKNIEKGVLLNHHHYFRNSMYLLFQFVRNDIYTIFHFNFILHESVINDIKKKYLFSKTIYTAHSIAFNEFYEDNFSQNIENEKEFLSKIDKICCLSDSTQEIFIKKYHIDSSRISRINNGLKEIRTLISNKNKEELMLKYNLPKNSTLILYVGRLDFNKGLSYLIESVKDLLSKGEDYYLIIVGGGYFDPFVSLTRYYWRNIFFTGRLPQSAVQELYQICDIGVLLSFSEQCSYVAIEMMMFGLPIIVSDAKGLNEVFTDKHDALKIKLQKNNKDILSIKEITKKIKLLSQDKFLKDKLKNNAYLLYKNKYDLVHFRQNILSLYEI